MMIFLFEFRNFSKSLPLLWMQEKLLQVWLSLLHCDWYIWWGTHAARCTCGGQRAALQSPLLLPFHLHLGFRSNTGHQAQTTCVFTPELSRWPSPTFLPETGCLPKPAVVGLGNAGEPVLGCAWQCWSYSVTGRTCFSNGGWGSRLRLSCLGRECFIHWTMLPAPLTFCYDMDFLFY